MTIVSKDAIRAAFERAAAMGGDREAAIKSTAQALCLDPATVREVVEEVEA